MFGADPNDDGARVLKPANAGPSYLHSRPESLVLAMEGADKDTIPL